VPHCCRRAFRTFAPITIDALLRQYADEGELPLDAIIAGGLVAPERATLIERRTAGTFPEDFPIIEFTGTLRGIRRLPH
jgi:hypothetical protein